MYFGLVFYPRLELELAELIDEIRQKHDPTVGFIKPHITIVFPVPDSVSMQGFISHVTAVLTAWRPFEICLSGFHKSDDHWLFLTVERGKREIKQLYRSLYTGILEEYRRDDIEFMPHLGRGLFIKGDGTLPLFQRIVRNLT